MTGTILERSYDNLATTNMLLCILVTTFIICGSYFYWTRRERLICGQFYIWTFFDISWIFMKIHNIIFRLWYRRTLIYGITSADDVKKILTSPSCLEKNWFYEYAKVFVGNGIFTAPLRIWRPHRKAISPAFSQRVLDSFVEVMVEKSNIMVQELGAVSGKGKFDILYYAANCTVDTFYETALGVRDKTLPPAIQLVNLSERILQMVFRRAFNMLYHVDLTFQFFPSYKEQEQLYATIRKLAERIVSEKKRAHEIKNMESEKDIVASVSDGRENNAFLDLLLETSYNQGKFTEEEMICEVNTFIIAGVDTTTVTSCFVLMCLGMFQDIQQKVYDEVYDVLGPDNTIEASNLPKLKYTDRVIKETLRLFPIVTFIARVPQEDLQLESHFVPAGCSVVIGIQSMHRNPKYWPEPENFDPDRFLPEEVAKRHPYAYIPFSAGPRNCIGMRYSLMVLKTLVATIVRRYRLYSDYKSIKDVKLKTTNLVMRAQDGYKISVELRQ